MPRCEICKEFKFSLTHKCPPKWQVNIPDYDGDDNWVDVYAFSSEFAAAKRAEEYDDGDYALLDGGEVEVLVKDVDGNILKYTCWGESVPEYRATKISDDADLSGRLAKGDPDTV